jgi:hypothetical protein
MFSAGNADHLGLYVSEKNEAVFIAFIFELSIESKVRVKGI